MGPLESPRNGPEVTRMEKMAEPCGAVPDASARVFHCVWWWGGGGNAGG